MEKLRERRETYAAGGARGAMLNQASVETRVWVGVASTGAMAGASPIAGAEAAIAAPAVAQKGQKCEVPFAEARSAQKWNCAARNTRPSKRAQTLNLPARCNMQMLIVGRKSYSSLGRNGISRYRLASSSNKKRDVETRVVQARNSLFFRLVGLGFR